MVSYQNENYNDQVLNENIRGPEKLSVTLLGNTKLNKCSLLFVFLFLIQKLES